MSQGRKERTPAQLAVLAQAREKAKIVIAERAKLNALVKKDEPEPVPEKVPPPEPQPEAEPEAPPPLPSESLPVKAPPEPEPLSESEDEEPRLPSPKYRYIHGVGYIKIK
jgi:hypothetical protein